MKKLLKYRPRWIRRSVDWDQYSKMADKTNIWPTLNVEDSTAKFSIPNEDVRSKDADDAKHCIATFLHNGRFSVLAVLCSLPLVYFGGERLFGVGTICLLTVYLLHVTFTDTKSSLIGYVVSLGVMQFCVLFSIGPLLWHSFFNLILLLLYNVFIVITGGLGLIQFEIFRKDEMAFCANIEYFLFLLYPPSCLLIMVWIMSMIFGVHLAPYLLIIFGFPICHTFLDSKLQCSFMKSDYVLGQPEKTLAILNFVFCPSIVYFLVNFSYLLQYSSWIAMCFCVSVPLFLVTFLDTSDIRDLADINNSQWQFFQVASGCASLILGNILVYVHGMVDGLHAAFLGIILVCTTTVFITVKYRYSQMVSIFACALLLATYIAWFSLQPWNLSFSIGTTITLSFFTTELLVLILGLLSVLAIAVSNSNRYKSFLNQILVLHTFGFVILEDVFLEASGYLVSMTIITSVVMLYMVQRLHHVGRLTKTCSLICISLHSSKLVLLAVTTGLNLQTLGNLTLISSFLGGFCLSCTVTNILLFEHGNHIDRQKALLYSGCLLFSLTTLSPTFLRVLWIIMTHSEPTTSHTIGLILALTGGLMTKLTFLHMNDDVSKKQSLVIFLLGLLVIVVQPYFNILEIITHVPKIMLREASYETWQVALAEYLILPWGLLFSLTIVLILSLKLLPLKELSSLALHILSCVIGAPLGLYFAHLVLLPYPQISSSCLCIPYMLSSMLVTNSLLLAFKNVLPFTNPAMYLLLLFVSISSVVIEVTQNIRITILQAPIPPSVVFQGIAHLVKSMQFRQECELQTSLDIKKSIFPCVACDVSVMFVFLFGWWFTPMDYYDILIIPVCGVLLLLSTNEFFFKTVGKGEGVLNMFIFSLVLGLILYYRTLRQLPPLGKMSFWIVVAFLIEFSIVMTTLAIFAIVVMVFWKQKMSRTEERGLAILAPVFTLLLFYGRTSAGQTLGVIGPTLALYTFYCPFR